MKAQIVVAEVCREMGLVVVRKKWFGLCNVAPFGEAGAPPMVIFGNRVKLWEQERKAS